MENQMQNQMEFVKKKGAKEELNKALKQQQQMDWTQQAQKRAEKDLRDALLFKEYYKKNKNYIIWKTVFKY
jgi:hypothetical protein